MSAIYTKSASIKVFSIVRVVMLVVFCQRSSIQFDIRSAYYLTSLHMTTMSVNLTPLQSVPYNDHKRSKKWLWLAVFDVQPPQDDFDPQGLTLKLQK